MERVRNAIGLVIFGLLLSACGGGGGGGNGGDGGSGGGTQPTSYTVSTTVTGNGSGTISPGSRSVTPGGTTTLSVNPANGSSIASVSGCGGTLSGTTYTTAAINSNCTVTVTFSLYAYLVTARAGTGGSISPDSAVVAHGTATTFTLTPNSGFEIESVSGCGGSLSGSTYTTGPTAAACSVTASFRQSSVTPPPQATFTVSTSTTGTGIGTITPGSATVNEGQATIFTLTAGTGSEIESVTGCGGSISGSNYTTGPISANCQVTASFRAVAAPPPATFSVTTATSGNGTGSITPASAIVTAGQATSLQVMAGTGSSITSVTGCGGSLSGSTYTTAPINANCQITAAFSLNSHTVTATAGQGGSVSPTTTSVQYGSTATFTVTPSGGYSIASVTGCGGSLNGTTYTTGPVTNACAVSASFTPLSFFLADNGATVRCPNAEIGDSGVINGRTYTKRTRHEITASNASTTCTSGITDMSDMFYGATNSNPSLEHWDTSSVTNMSRMFSQTSNFNPNIGGWDTRAVRNMSYMFAGSGFNRNIGAWDTSSVTDMSAMFMGAYSFNQDIGGWDTLRVLDMGAMFYNASFFNQDLSRWCVQQISSRPTFFDDGAIRWTTTLNRPPWSTRPRWGSLCRQYWPGDAYFGESVTVPHGDTVYVYGGSQILFGGGASLVINGRLEIVGDGEVTLASAGSERWRGVVVENTEQEFVSKLRIRNADVGIEVIDSPGLIIWGNVVENVTTAIRVTASDSGSRHGVGIYGNEVSGANVGLIAQQSAVAISRNRIAAGEAGIVLSGDCLNASCDWLAGVNDNLVTDAEVGISIHRVPASVSGNDMVNVGIGLELGNLPSPQALIERNNIGGWRSHALLNGGTGNVNAGSLWLSSSEHPRAICDAGSDPERGVVTFTTEGEAFEQSHGYELPTILESGTMPGVCVTH